MGLLSFQQLIGASSLPPNLCLSERLILRYCRFFFLLVVVQAVLVGLTNLICILLLPTTFWEQKTVYSVVFILGAIHQTWIVWDGIKKINIIEIVGFVGLNLMYFLYGVIHLLGLTAKYYSDPPLLIANSSSIPEYSLLTPMQLEKTRFESSRMLYLQSCIFLTIIALSALFITTILSFFFIHRVYAQFLWEMFKVAGNNYELRKIWFNYLAFQFFLKVGLVLFLIQSLISSILLLYSDSVSFLMNLFSYAYILIVYCIGVYSISKQEKILGVFTYIFLKLVAAIYVIYFLYLVIQKSPLFFLHAASSTYFMVYLCCVGLMNFFCLILNTFIAFRCMSFFGKNLPEFIQSAESRLMDRRVGFSSTPNLLGNEIQRKKILSDQQMMNPNQSICISNSQPISPFQSSRPPRPSFQQPLPDASLA